MICPVCANNTWQFERKYTHRDKYEKWCGVPESITRTWYKCDECGLLKVLHSYSTELLSGLYTDGYRSKGFRGSSIDEVFNRIQSLPLGESENKQRVGWLKQFLNNSSLDWLDIGSGLGVFPYEISKLSPHYNVKTLEPNKDSAAFIGNRLHLDCSQSFYKRGMFGQRFDWISCVHVLEHQKRPEDMLLDFRGDLKVGGKVFIEVPDACEFNYLPTEHDEFNSTHLYFFTPTALMQLMESCGYRVTDLRMSHTMARDLSRIMVVAECR